MNQNFSGKNAYEHLRVLAEEIGPRHGGSKNEDKASQYIYDYFKKIGLKTRFQQFPIYSFETADASLRIPGGKELSCIAIPITANTSPSGITKPVIFLEGNEAAHLDAGVSGKIVVMFNSFTEDLLKRFISYKPAGLVSIQTRPNMKHLRKPGNSGTNRKYGSVPSILMTLNDGLALVKNLPEKLTMQVTTKQERVTKGRNVIADLPGCEPDDDLIGVCAHYDSVWAGPGAFDNGAGTAAMMELARVYKESGTRRNLRFMAFGGEEMGVWGSKYYIKVLHDEDVKIKKNKDFELDGLCTELDNHRFLINLDMMGPLYGTSTAVPFGDTDIAAATRLLANELRYAITIRDQIVYSSDNMTFNHVGIPGISFYRGPFESVGGHTEEDTIKSCSPEGLAHIGKFIEAWIDRYVESLHSFPFKRALPDQAKSAVAKWFKGKDPLDYEVLGPAKKYAKGNSAGTSKSKAKR
ncbi:MAG: Zn-dependent exopeptidase M28 [Spirochaetales bacterium]|jgi:aminopeptidase YwaD|nr:Zn-dependent exopeptidase M28 [Spirochaetales bacterium]